MIAFGAVKGWSVVHKFGANYDLGSNVEDIWAAGGVYTYPTSAQALEVLSDNANDTSSGTGARSVQVEGLDGDWKEQSEIVVLDGTTPVSLVNTYIRINRMKVLTTGTYGIGSAGDITLRISGGGATQALVQETTFDGVSWDYGQTQLARYSVPAGKSAFISRISINAESNKRTDFALFQRINSDIAAAPFSSRRLVESWSGLSSSLEFVFDAPKFFPEKTDIIFQARLASGNNGRVTASFEIFIGDMG